MSELVGEPVERGADAIDLVERRVTADEGMAELADGSPGPCTRIGLAVGRVGLREVHQWVEVRVLVHLDGTVLSR